MPYSSLRSTLVSNFYVSFVWFLSRKSEILFTYGIADNKIISVSVNEISIEQSNSIRAVECNNGGILRERCVYIYVWRIWFFATVDLAWYIESNGGIIFVSEETFYWSKFDDRISRFETLDGDIGGGVSVLSLDIFALFLTCFASVIIIAACEISYELLRVNS